MTDNQGPVEMAAGACQPGHHAGQAGQSSPDQMDSAQPLFCLAVWRFGLVLMVRQYGWRWYKAAYDHHLFQQHQLECQVQILPPRNHYHPASAPRVIFPTRQSPALHRHESSRHRASDLIPAVRVRGGRL